MTGAIWINVKTKRVYKMKKNEIFSKTEICSIFDNIISQNISFYFKISLVFIYPWQVSWFHTWKRIDAIYNSYETTKVVNLPSPSSKKTQNNHLIEGLTFSINSFSVVYKTLSLKVFRILYLRTKQQNSKGFW